jgi:hypothetical protein
MSNKTGLIYFSLIIFMFSSVSLNAVVPKIRIRTIAGMEPVSLMSVKNWENTSSRWNCAYGFTPGIEVFYIFSKNIEAGIGFKYQLKRKVLKDGSSENGSFSYMPLFAAVRFSLSEDKTLKPYLLLKIGYNFFNTDSSFREEWSSQSGGSLTSVYGGLYGSASLGISVRITDRPGWILHYTMDAGYSFHGAGGSNTVQSYPINYQTMTVDFSLDWLL